MKQFLIFCICPFFILPSCRYSCADATSSLSLIGLTSNETDTIIVRKFSKSASFTTIPDTFLLNKTNSSYYLKNDTLEINAPFGSDNGLLSRYDYEIYLPKSNRLYQISEIMEDYRSINTGFKKVGCINSITSYKINGKLIPNDTNGYTLFISQ